MLLGAKELLWIGEVDQSAGVDDGMVGGVDLAAVASELEGGGGFGGPGFAPVGGA
ncbi:hypothetical protein ES708_25785 [subsurface metagenome]